MKELLYYLVQVFVTSGILYAWYHFALRNKKFHRYNRFYLLVATVISMTIPFLDIPVYFTQTETDSSFVLQTLTVISSAGSDASVIAVANESHHINWFSWQNLSYCFYILFASIALFRIVISLVKIRRIAKNNPVEQLDNIRFVNTNEPGTPFSFFRWLFWNRKIELHSDKGEQIFRHELFHIKQKHSRDIMYMELLTAVLWINPFFHLVKKEVKAIHEFLADQFAVTENTKWQYAELLLMQVLNTNQTLVNPFFHNQIKRRIAMITTSKKPSYQYLRKLMVFPIAAIVIALFAFSYKERQADKDDLISKMYQNIADTTGPLLKNDKVFDKVDIEASFPGGDLKWRQYLDYNMWKGNIKFDKTAPEGTYTTVVIFIVDKEGNISDVKALTAHGYGMEQEAIRMIKTGPKWTPPVLNGKQVKAYRRQPITFVSGKDQKNFQSTAKTTGNDSNIVFDKVETEPSFPGGEAKWRQYLEKCLDASVPAKKKAPDGTYTVLVQFIVDKEGHISDVRALTNHGYGMEDEALRAIRKGPKWIPAVQNGRQVNAYKKQPITFMVGKGEKNFPSAIKTTSNELNEVVVATLSHQGDTPPSFPGGDSAWKRYLMKNVNGLVPLDSGAPAGVYKVMVQFVVHEDGSLSDVKALTHHGYGMENEAMRVIKVGPKWIPGKQNGHIVRAYVHQPITFEISEEPEDKPKQNSLPTTITTSPGIPKITVAELKKASAYKLLQMPEGTEIVSFYFTIDLANGDIVEIPNSGNKFNEATIAQINKAISGRMFTIDQIKIMKDGREMKIPSKAYEVTD